MRSVSFAPWFHFVQRCPIIHCLEVYGPIKPAPSLSGLIPYSLFSRQGINYSCQINQLISDRFRSFLFISLFRARSCFRNSRNQKILADSFTTILFRQPRAPLKSLMPQVNSGHLAMIGSHHKDPLRVTFSRPHPCRIRRLRSTQICQRPLMLPDEIQAT